MLYVNMRDKFMSGWGGAARGHSYKIVACDTLEQAEAIEQAARQRPEMRAVSIADKPRRPRTARDRVSLSHFSDMGGPWLRFWRGPHPKAETREC